MKALKYYYYRMFKYYKNGDSIPYFSTFSTISVFAFFNLLTIFSLLETIIGQKFSLPEINGFKRLWLILIIIPLYIIYQQYFVKKGHHNQILKEFANETKKQKRLSIFYTIMYFVFTIVVFFFSLWIRQRIAGF